jgi:hypothetical protein
MYGLQAMDSSIDQRWGFFIPWLERRMVRHDMYKIDGTLFAQLSVGSIWHGTLPSAYEENRKIEDSVPRARYQFKDFDGELIEVDCYIEEREWKQGTGWFKWVSIFCKSDIGRSVDLNFSSEVGPRKGSWKGGTMGHSVKTYKGESIEGAFRHYCTEHNLTFIGAIPWMPRVEKPRIEDQCCEATINVKVSKLS